MGLRDFTSFMFGVCVSVYAAYFYIYLRNKKLSKDKPAVQEWRCRGCGFPISLDTEMLKKVAAFQLREDIRLTALVAFCPCCGGGNQFSVSGKGNEIALLLIEGMRAIERKVADNQKEAPQGKIAVDEMIDFHFELQNVDKIPDFGGIDQ
ncbi:MAG: hypothetical protein PHS46_08350 [Candidatus Omnitrophica bacterium]|nr:hypothetical protein [Candidatus Omnitrophota bacterium]